MRALAQVVLAAAEFDDDFLLALAVLLDDAGNLAALEQRSADLDVVTVADEQDFAEFHRGAGLCIELLHLEDGAVLDPILFAARGDDRVHLDCSGKPFETKALSPVPFRREAHSTYRPPVGQTDRQTVNKPLESTP